MNRKSSAPSGLTGPGLPGAPKQDWANDPNGALLRRAMGISAEMPLKEQNVLVRDFREKVRQLAGIHPDYPLTPSQYKATSKWEEMVEAVDFGMAEHGWREQGISGYILTDVIQRGRENKKRKINEEKRARGEPILRGRQAEKDALESLPLEIELPVFVEETQPATKTQRKRKATEAPAPVPTRVLADPSAVAQLSRKFAKTGHRISEARVRSVANSPWGKAAAATTSPVQETRTIYPPLTESPISPSNNLSHHYESAPTPPPLVQMDVTSFQAPTNMFMTPPLAVNNTGGYVDVENGHQVDEDDVDEEYIYAFAIRIPGCGPPKEGKVLDGFGLGWEKWNTCMRSLIQGIEGYEPNGSFSYKTVSNGVAVSLTSAKEYQQFIQSALVKHEVAMDRKGRLSLYYFPSSAS
ncbi:hypothetical protein FPQ18DRAFT_321908 [Pyronema domesticum]|uniref:Uncharacterized protein n=1 Tax=Pyronema omphalodes (strain CBS 100304) TaxID=1076935 RepID=U4LLT6_PYROM|nr:hypothetical protein FPQ18DRAFT_321908 [Pyronema domesticum]CCX32893.1 Protein of unknown function [Pyronema omphalodes CBS 100304]